MLLKNIASQLVQLGALIKTTDGTRLTSSATVRWCKDGTWADGAGTLSVEETDQYKYTPTQAETNCTQWAIAVDHASAVQPLVLGGRTMLSNVGDVTYWNGTAVATPDTAGYPKVTAKAGTGTGELNLSSGVVDANTTKIAGTAVNTSSAQLGVNVVNFGGTAGTFTSGRPETLNVAQQRTLYVTKSGNNSNDGFTYATAKLTIAGATAIARNGDKIWIGAGTYSEQVDLDTANLYRITLEGEGRDVVTITATVASFFGVVMAEHGTILRNLTITAAASDGTGVQCINKNDCEVHNCTINGYWDGLTVAYGTSYPRGFRMTNSRVTGTYDGLNFAGAKDFLIENCSFYSTGAYGSVSYDTSAARGGVNSPTGIFRNCTFEIDHGVAHAGTTKKGTCVVVGGDDSNVVLEKCLLRGRKSQANDHGTLRGVGPDEATPAKYKAKVADCIFDLVSSGDGTTYDADCSVSGTSLTVRNSPLASANRINGIANLVTDLVGTTALRTLDVSATGEAGIDFDNIKQATGSTTLTNITVPTVTGLTNGVSVAAGGITSASFAANSITAGALASDAATEIGAAANPWSALVASNNGAGTFGALVGTNVDAKISEAGGASAVSPFLVAKGHSWKFDTPSQTTSPQSITEIAAGFDNLLVEMDLSGAMSGNASVLSINSVGIADVGGATEPTVVESAKRADQKAVIITLDGTAATAATYTIGVNFTTTDGQTMTRKGRLVVQ